MNGPESQANQTGSAASPGVPPAFLRIANVLFLVVTGTLFLWFLYSHRSDWTRLLLEGDPTLLLSAFVLTTCFQFVQAYLIAGVLRALGASTPYLETMRLILVSLLGKYIPGKVWIFAMRSSFFAARNVPVRTVLTAASIEHIYVILTAAILYLAVGPPIIPLVERFAPYGAALLVMTLIFSPGLVIRFVNVILVKLGRGTVDARLSRGRSTAFTMQFLLSWLILGTGVGLLAISLFPSFGWADFPALAGAYALSVVGGFLVLIAPGGIGVREGLFALLLGSRLAPGDALFLALAARIMTSIAEILAIGLIQLLSHRHSIDT